MKAWIPFATLAALSAAPAAHAQDAPPGNLIDINPATLLWGEVSVEYERALGSALSIVIGPQALLFTGPIDTNYASEKGLPSKGIGLTLSLHIFPGAQALHGFWIGPEFDADWATTNISGVTVSGALFSVYGILGYTFIPWPNIAISLGIGAGLRLNSASGTDSSGNTIVEFGPGFVPTGRAAIGYAF